MSWIHGCRLIERIIQYRGFDDLIEEELIRRTEIGSKPLVQHVGSCERGNIREHAHFGVKSTFQVPYGSIHRLKSVDTAWTLPSALTGRSTI